MLITPKLELMESAVVLEFRVCSYFVEFRCPGAAGDKRKGSPDTQDREREEELTLFVSASLWLNPAEGT